GDIIEARLLAPLENYPGNPSVIRGKLAGLEDSILNIEPCAITGDGEIIPENLPPASFPFEAARRISRIHIFKKPQKPGGKKNVPAGKKA
ncbi:MAG: ribosome maturation factor RimP, partial [Desulfovibrio sp.]